MKKFQNAHIVILILLIAGTLLSIFFAIHGLKEMFDAKKSMEVFPNSIPTLTQVKQSYVTSDYNEVLKLHEVTETGVELKVNDSGISILSPDIANENEVRNALITLLALDKNLKIESMCANPNNSCEGNALAFILKGEKIITTVNTPE